MSSHSTFHVILYSWAFDHRLNFRVILIEYEDYKIKYELFCVYCERFSGVRNSIKNRILKNETKNLSFPILQHIPISFLLGFYVTQVTSSIFRIFKGFFWLHFFVAVTVVVHCWWDCQVVSRWWAQFMSLPWPDTLAR